MTATDATLLQGFVATRDESAFEAVLERYGPLVWRVCREVLRDPNDAEDAFQATFLVLVRSAGSIRNRDALGRWLYETAYRISLRAKSQAARRDVRTRQGVEMVPAKPGKDEVEARELRPALHDEVNRLPAKLRAAIILCYFEGMTQDEAALRLRCPVRTLKGRLARGRELLRSRLSRRGLTVTALLLMILLTEKATAAPVDLVESTRHAGSLALNRGRLPETVPPVVQGLVRGLPPVSRGQVMLIASVGLLVASLASSSLGMILGSGGRGPIDVITTPPPPAAPTKATSCHGDPPPPVTQGCSAPSEDQASPKLVD